MRVLENVPLAPYTTFGIGGPARWFVEAHHEDEVVEAVRFAREHATPLFVLGGGSNLLVSDEGFPGLILHILLKGIEQNDRNFSVAAGEEWDAFVTTAVSQNYAGVECLAGIPGSVGGTPVQNVGAYGQEVSSTIRCVRAFDCEQNRFVALGRDDCHFGYRRSIFNTQARGRYIVTRVEYDLIPDGDPTVSYKDLKQYFEDWTTVPSLGQVSAAVREIRHRKGMLLVAGEPDAKSAGSFFKNPIITPDHFEQIVVQTGGANVPGYPTEGGQIKIPAAWLLEQTGFHKGHVHGRAGISSRHSLALINRNGASAGEIIALRDRIVAAVEQKFGIRLDPEPVWVG